MTRLRAALERARQRAPDAARRGLGHGPLALVGGGVRQLTPRIRAYTLCTVDGSPLLPAAAGAHLDLPVPMAAGRLGTRRHSIASDPAQRDSWEIAVLREDGGSGGSAALYEHHAVGLRLGPGLPGNNFALNVDDRPAVPVAGGIGITPTRAMALALRRRGVDFRLHIAGRSRRELAWIDELEREFGAQLSMYASDQGRRLDVDTMVRDAPADALIHFCGPARLIDAVHDAAARVGAADRLRCERFTPERRPGDAPIVVELRRSGRCVVVRSDQTIFEAVQAAGVAAPSSCRAGSCATCATKVLGGTPAHRDTALSHDERGRAGLMCIRVSRARTPTLTLDL